MARIEGNGHTACVDDGGASAPIPYPVARKASSASSQSLRHSAHLQCRADANSASSSFGNATEARSQARSTAANKAGSTRPALAARCTSAKCAQPFSASGQSTFKSTSPAWVSKRVWRYARSAGLDPEPVAALVGKLPSGRRRHGGICRNGICCSGTWRRKYLGISSRSCGAHSEEPLPRRHSPRNRKIEVRKQSTESLAPVLPGDCRNMLFQRILRAPIAHVSAPVARRLKTTGTLYNSRPVGRRRTGIAGTPRQVIPARG